MSRQKKKASQITIDDLIAELDNARLVAGTNGNATAMISATMAKAKLCGLDRPATKPNEAIQQISDLMNELSNEASQSYNHLIQ